MRELPVGRRLCRSPSTGWRTGRRWVALRRQRLRCGIGRDTGRWLRYGQRRSPDGGSSGSDGGTGSGGSGGGGNSPDAGSGGGTAISAEQLTSGEKAQVLALDDQNVYWASYENASKWQVTWGGSDIARSDVNGGKAYFAQSAYSSFDGCIVRANPNGAGATCIDRGKHSYIDVKVDDTQVYFIRDGDVWRLPRQ